MPMMTWLHICWSLHRHIHLVIVLLCRRCHFLYVRPWWSSQRSDVPFRSLSVFSSTTLSHFPSSFCAAFVLLLLFVAILQNKSKSNTITCCKYNSNNNVTCCKNSNNTKRKTQQKRRRHNNKNTREKEDLRKKRRSREKSGFSKWPWWRKGPVSCVGTIV